MIRTALRAQAIRSPATFVSSQHFLRLRVSAVGPRRLITSSSPRLPNPPNVTDSEKIPPSQTQEERAPVDTDAADSLARAQHHISSWSEKTAILLRERVDAFTANLADTFKHLGQELNKITGYGEIEELKRRVGAQGKRSPSSLCLRQLMAFRGAYNGCTEGSKGG